MGDCRYHITMQVTADEENAIRSMFKENKWFCLLQVLSNETVSDIIQCGFTDVFPVLSLEEENISSNQQEEVNEVKSEINRVEAVAEDTFLHTEGMKDEDEEHAAEESDDSEDTDVEDEQSDNEQDDKDGEHDLYGSDDTDIVDEAIFALTKDVANDLDGRFSDIKDEETTVESVENHQTLKKKRKIKQRRLMKNKKDDEGTDTGGQWKCDACGNFYRDRRRLRKHYYSVHRELMPKPSCPVCNEVFETRAEMFKHKREKQHNTSLWMLKDYYCDACGKRLSRYDSLLKHKRFTCGRGDDEERKTFPCDLCGKLFKESHYVEAHKERIHCKVEKVCDVCGKVCIDERALKCHRIRHDVLNKKYKCSYCEKTFFSAANLNQHVRTHTKEKPYKCPICSYTSGVMGNVRKHTNNVHKQKLTAIDLRKAKKMKETQPVQQSYAPNAFEYNNSGIDNYWQQ